LHPLTAAQTHPDSALRVLTEANAATSPDVVDHVNDAWLCPYGHICSGDLRTIFGRCGPSDLICVRQRDQNDLGAFAAYAQHPVAVLFAKISDISAGGLEDRKPRSPSIATSAKSQGDGDSRAAVSNASNCRWVNPKVGDSAGTEGRRTCSAGECSSRPSMTHVR